MKKENYICIVCPLSCDLELTDDNGELTVTGNTCPRGANYAKNEYTDPKRMITTTVRLTGGDGSLLPVISTEPVPKKLLSGCLDRLSRLTVSAPIRMNDVVVRDICGTGTDVVAARNAELKD